MRKVIVLVFAVVAAFSAIAASVAGADPSRVASPAAPNCKAYRIGLTGPYTGQADSGSRHRAAGGGCS